MRIAIIGAMDVEVISLIEKLEDKKLNSYHHYNFYEGILFGHELVVIKSGIGKVASGMLVASLVANYPKFDLIINVGVSGGVFGRVQIADVVVANYLAYADVNVPSSNLDYGQIPGFPAKYECNLKIIKDIKSKYYEGMILTGDKFFTSIDEVNKIINNYFKDDNVLCLDMESTALAQAAYKFKIDYLAIRAISDIIGDENQSKSYDDNLDKAAKASNEFIIQLLRSIKN